MNLTPAAGDRWTRPGETELVVTGVRNGKVLMRRDGYDCNATITEYLKLAAVCISKGDTLHKKETESEEIYFE